MKVLKAFNPWWSIGMVPSAFAKEYRRFAYYEAMKRLEQRDLRRTVVLTGTRRVMVFQICFTDRDTCSILEQNKSSCERYTVPARRNREDGFAIIKERQHMKNTSSILDVIAFPKVQNTSDLMMRCPDVVDDKQLDELSIAATRMEAEEETAE